MPDTATQDERRKIKRRGSDTCPHDCHICFRYNLQMKWLLVGASGAIVALYVFASMILANKTDIAAVTKSSAETKKELAMSSAYTVESLNDIKRAMGLQVRMPPKLEALKDGAQ